MKYSFRKNQQLKRSEGHIAVSLISFYDTTTDVSTKVRMKSLYYFDFFSRTNEIVNFLILTYQLNLFRME